MSEVHERPALTGPEAANERLLTLFVGGLLLSLMAGVVAGLAWDATGGLRRVAIIVAALLGWLGSMGALAGVIGWAVKQGIAASRSA